MSRNNFLKGLEACKPGDLICIDWCDASIGKSRANHGSIEVPVKSIGIFVMLARAKTLTVLLAQNCFEYADGFFDVDYTAIPAAWASEVHVIQPQFVSRIIAENLAASFLVSKNQVMRSTEPRAFRIRQQHLLSHERRRFLNAG
jgi:hypothetical protein